MPFAFPLWIETFTKIKWVACKYLDKSEHIPYQLVKIQNIIVCFLGVKIMITPRVVRIRPKRIIIGAV